MISMRIGRVQVLGILMLFLLQSGIPTVSNAESGLSAGFAPQSVWISRSHMVAGDSVNIFAVVYNSSNAPITGQIVFLVDDTPIGNKDFALKEGEAQIASRQWIAQAGDHLISARITNTFAADTKKTIVVLNRSSGDISVNVEKPPLPPSPAAQVISSVSSAVVTGVASTAPAVMATLASLYGTTEALRENAKSALEKHVADFLSPSTTDKEKSSYGSPEDRSVNPGSAQSDSDGSKSLISTAGRYAALAGLAVVSSKTLFYAALALVLLILIQILRVSLRERRNRD